jgi:hypothetical protein
LLRSSGGFAADGSALASEQIAAFRLLLLEQTAVLCGFQLGWFDGAAGFQLGGELIVGELVGSALGVYLGLPLGVGVEEARLSGIRTWE